MPNKKTNFANKSDTGGCERAFPYDGIRHRIIHPVYVFGALVLVAVRYRQLFRETDTWLGISRWLAERLM